MNSDKLKAWVQASRVPFFVATLVPLGLGGVVSNAAGYWDTMRWIVVLAACFLVHLCTNLANDYFDFVAGADSGDSIGGSRVIQEGKITLSQLRQAMILCYSLAFVCGLWIVWVSQLRWLGPVMLFSFFSSLYYTAPPVRYGYRGLGELFVGINMGPVMVAGTAAVVSGQFILRAFWLSIPIGLMVAMILYYQSLSDIPEDEAVGKRTLAVRLGKARAIWGMRAFFAGTLGSILVLVWQEQIHPVALVTTAGMIPAYRIDRMISRTRDWKSLHDKGSAVRMFYLTIGLIMILTVAWLG